MKKTYNILGYKIHIEKNKPKEITFTDEEIRDMAIELYLGKEITTTYFQDETKTSKIIAFDRLIKLNDSKRIVFMKDLNDEGHLRWESEIITDYERMFRRKYKKLIKGKVMDNE